MYYIDYYISKYDVNNFKLFYIECSHGHNI